MSRKRNRPFAASASVLLIVALAWAVASCRSSEPTQVGASAEKPPLEFIEVPANRAASSTLPIVVAVHGLGDSPERFKDVFSGFDDTHAIVLPRAPKPHGRGFSWFPVPRFPVLADELGPGIEVAADRMARFLSWIIASNRPDKTKPIITGFSQGGMISFAVAAKYPELISLAVPIGGALPSSVTPDSEKTSPLPPVRALHGASDDVVPPADAKRAVEALRAAGYEAELKLYPGVGHSVSAKMRRELQDSVEFK